MKAKQKAQRKLEKKAEHMQE